MENNIDFKNLWAGQKISPPNTADLFLQLKKLKKTNMRRLILTNVMLVLTSVFIVFVWIYFQPQFLTSKIGIVMIILAMAVFLFAYNQSYSLFRNDTQAKSNIEYLKDLLIIKKKQKFLQTRILNLYFVLLSLGIGLYMYEYTVRMSIGWGTFTYALTAAWILFNWFYLRPRQIRKEEKKLAEVIKRFESVQEQLDEK